MEGPGSPAEAREDVQVESSADQQPTPAEASGELAGVGTAAGTDAGALQPAAALVEAAPADGLGAEEKEEEEEEEEEEEGANGEDKVSVMTRQLSRLSIPDVVAAPAAAAGSEDGTADGPDSATALVGLEELPMQLSPGRANFSQTTEPSPELFERVAMGSAAAPDSPPVGFYPRSKSVSPVQRKIAQLEAEAWAGIPFDPKPTPSRLERELGYTDFRRNEQSFSDRSEAPHPQHPSSGSSPKKTSSQEEGGHAASPGPTPEAMSEMLQRHKEKQERLRQKAAARSPDHSPLPPSSQALMEQQAEAWGNESLGDVMLPSKSRVQLEKEEWQARQAAEQAEQAEGEAALVAAEQADGHAALAAVAPGGVYRCSSPPSSEGGEDGGEDDPAAAVAAEEEEGQRGDTPGVAAEADGEVDWDAGAGGQQATATAEEGEEGDLGEFEGMSLEELEAALAAAEAEAAAALAAAEEGGDGYVTTAAAFGGVSLDDLQKRKSRLERERDAALAAAMPRVGARSTLPAVPQGPGLEEELLQHKSRLEQERDAALAAAAPRIAPRSNLTSAHEEQPALELMQHKSRLEQERDAALAAAAPRIAPRSTLTSAHEEQPALELLQHKSRLEQERDAALAEAAPRIAPRSTLTSEHEEQPPLELLQHKSRLEQERDAALAAAAPRVSARSSRSVSLQEEAAAQPGLAESLLIHKSRLELEKEAAKEAAAAGAAGGAVEVKADASSRRGSSQGGGPSLEQSLGSKRLSRLEQEQAAARAAAENAAAGVAAAAAPGSGGGAAAPKSRLQLEREAVAKAEKAKAAAALLARARAAAAAKAAAAQQSSGLAEAMRPAQPSKLQQESEAWRRAVGG